MIFSRKGSPGLEPYRDNYYHDDPINQKAVVLRDWSRKLNKAMVSVVFFVCSALFIQATLAANINLNSQKIVEFGQGYTGTPACSNGSLINMSPINAFANDVGSTGTHYLSGILVSGIPSSCNGYDFTLNAYSNSGTLPLAIFNVSTTDAVVYDNAGTFQVGLGSSGTSVTSGVGSFTVNFSNPVALSTSIYKFTIQSSSHKIYAVGDTGPGGGKIFYYSAAAFTETGTACASSCHYLEAPPTTGLNAWTDVTAAWSGNTSVALNTTSTLIGAGFTNTNLIVNQSSGGNTAGKAATLAQAYRGPSNLSDWFLPSQNELNQLYANISYAQAFTVGSYYWTSTEYSSTPSTYAYVMNPSNGSPGMGLKSNSYYIRPIRAF